MQRPIILPVEGAVGHKALEKGGRLQFATGANRAIADSTKINPIGAYQRCCTGIQERKRRIKPVPFLGHVRTCHLIRIHRATTEPLDPDMPHIASFVTSRVQRDHFDRQIIRGRRIKQQGDAFGMSGKQGKIDGITDDMSALRQRRTGRAARGPFGRNPVIHDRFHDRARCATTGTIVHSARGTLNFRRNLPIQLFKTAIQC